MGRVWAAHGYISWFKHAIGGSNSTHTHLEIVSTDVPCATWTPRYGRKIAPSAWRNHLEDTQFEVIQDDKSPGRSVLVGYVREHNVEGFLKGLPVGEVNTCVISHWL